MLGKLQKRRRKSPVPLTHSFLPYIQNISSRRKLLNPRRELSNPRRELSNPRRGLKNWIPDSHISFISIQRIGLQQ